MDQEINNHLKDNEIQNEIIINSKKKNLNKGEIIE